MPQIDLVRGFTLVRASGERVTYKTGLNEVAAEDVGNFMVTGLTAKPGERLQVQGAVGSVTPDPTPSVEQGEVAPVGQESTGKLAVPTGGGSAPKETSVVDPRPAPAALTGGTAAVTKKV